MPRQDREGGFPHQSGGSELRPGLFPAARGKIGQARQAGLDGVGSGDGDAQKDGGQKPIVFAEKANLAPIETGHRFGAALTAAGTAQVDDRHIREVVDFPSGTVNAVAEVRIL